MKQPRICAAITTPDLEVIRQAEPLVDLFEVRIDLIGDDWQEIAKKLGKPWIACNRSAAEGGQCQDNEERRIERLLQALEIGASAIDIELSTNNLTNTITLIKQHAECLLSYHNLEKTPDFDTMRQIIRQQIEAGADICKVVTTARSFEDNLRVLQLVPAFPEKRVVAFAMGTAGITSRVFCPLVGGDFTYASLAEGRESAPGQISVKDLKNIYEMIGSR
ncbi:MAG TPA: type I 3-dehydroquinate dehydratase [Dehalococcoidia bacterium]|nr:type I 3-dehydroquinate dehydratase [Dehalococcoidia bacterium]